MADFFEKPAEETPAEESFKLGDKEYSQEDLQKLVGLGELAQEAETKWNTPINKVFPEYTKATQKIKEYEAKIKEYEAPKPVENPLPNTQLTAEQKDEARRQLAELGFGEDQYRRIVREELAAKDLISNVNSIVTNQSKIGNPATTAEDLLTHMQETGIKDPTKAYKDMFESELDAIKEKKLATIRPQGMVTTEASTAGSKMPSTIKVNRANLAQIVTEALGGQG